MTEFAILLLFGLLAGFAILLDQARLTARGTPVRPLHKIVVKVPSPIGTNSGTDGAKRPGPVDLESISPRPASAASPDSPAGTSLADPRIIKSAAA
jgi:hypothetical protein